MKNMQQWMARADEQCRFLVELMPGGWESKARELGALRRTRSVKNPSALLRMLLLHLADGCSLQESATRITLAGWGQGSAVAVFKRMYRPLPARLPSEKRIIRQRQYEPQIRLKILVPKQMTA